MKVVINRCFGGFGLSMRADAAYLARKGERAYFFTDARDENGRIDFDAPKVPVTDLDAREFLVYVFTSPAPTWMDDDPSYFYSRELPRNDPDLVAVVEKLGEASWGRYAELAVIEIPDDVEWEIDEYDGREHVAEKHRTWS